ncbi:MAG: hypothetical protein AAGI11_19940 [Pseudomonadota bacterium]
MTASLSHAVLASLLLVWASFALGDDIDLYQPSILRGQFERQLELDFPAWPALENSDSSRLRAALIVALERLADTLAQRGGPAIALNVTGIDEHWWLYPRGIDDPGWQGEMDALLESLSSADETPSAGPTLPAASDDCGRRMRVQPLVGLPQPLPDNEQLTEHFYRMLLGTPPPAQHFVEPLLVAGPGAGGQWFQAQFQPAPGGAWTGNIKKLRYVNQRLLDARDQPLSFVDGRIPADALTYWSKPDTLGPASSDDRSNETGALVGRDGGFVSRGGAAGAIPAMRRLFTEHPLIEGETLALDAPEAIALLGPFLDPHDVLAEAEEMELLHWVRGFDSYDDDGDADQREPRAHLVGDVIHSRPVLLNYGPRPGSGHSATNPEQKLFFGSNDGFLRMLENTTPSGEESGAEDWAFIPLALLPRQAARAGREGEHAPGHLYGVDGPLVAWARDSLGNGDIDADKGDSAMIVFGLRRGGSAYFAMDVKRPDAPRLAWKLTPARAGFERMGLSFSEPQHLRVDWQGEPRQVILLGGGYDGGWQGDSRRGKDAGRTDDERGNAAWIIDAYSGELLWSVLGPGPGELASAGAEIKELRHGIAAGFAWADISGDGLADMAYVGDSGGDVWRLMLAGTGPDDWRFSRLASLGGTDQEDRRFFHAADLVLSKDNVGGYVGVLIASGNRADPHETAVLNQLYLLKDRLAPNGMPGSDGSTMRHADLPAVDATCSAEGLDCSAVASELGWRFPLPGAGEKGLSTPLTAGGVVSFTSFLPPDPAEPCAPALGSSRLYALRLRDGLPDTEWRHRVNLPDWSSEAALDLGPGLRGSVRPVGGDWMLPGVTGREDVVLPAPGSTWRRAAWWEYGVDEDL